jgi:hypothetical protein
MTYFTLEEAALLNSVFDHISERKGSLDQLDVIKVIKDSYQEEEDPETIELANDLMEKLEYMSIVNFTNLVITRPVDYFLTY